MTALLLSLLIALHPPMTVIAYSHYWPAWGGVNGNPHGILANGDAWHAWEYRGAACPLDWPLGTVVTLDGVGYTCVDRGAFVGRDTRSGAPIVDFLTDRPGYGFKELVPVVVRFTGGGE